MYNLTYQEWWRDWPIETQQPVDSDKYQVISDKVISSNLSLITYNLSLLECGAKSNSYC